LRITKHKGEIAQASSGDTDGISGQVQQLVGGLSITQEQNVGGNSCWPGKTPTSWAGTATTRLLRS